MPFKRMKAVGQAAYGVPDLFVDSDYVVPKCGPSVADLSYFRPNSAVVRNAKGVAAPSENQYTFKDGVDDGRAIPPYSRPGFDLVELVEFAKSQSDVVSKELDRIQKSREFEQYKQESAKLREQQVSNSSNVKNE